MIDGLIKQIRGGEHDAITVLEDHCLELGFILQKIGKYKFCLIKDNGFILFGFDFCHEFHLNETVNSRHLLPAKIISIDEHRIKLSQGDDERFHFFVSQREFLDTGFWVSNDYQRDC